MARGVRFEITDEDPFAEGPLDEETTIDDQGAAAGATPSEARPAADDSSNPAPASVPPQPPATVAPGAAGTGELRERSERRSQNLLHSRNARRIGAAAVVAALLLASALGAGRHDRRGPQIATPATPAGAASEPAHRHRRSARRPPTRRRHRRDRAQPVATTPPPAVRVRPPAVPATPRAVAPTSPPVREPAQVPSPSRVAGGGEFTFER